MLIITAVIASFLSSCFPEKQDYAAQEQQKIDDYFTQNPTLNFEVKESGLYYLETVAGDGELAQTHDTAYVFYTGKFLNGQIFDSNIGDDTLAFPVDEGWMIPGFDEAITYMREGSKSMMIIPSNLGYGPQGWYIIPGYTPLLYDVSLVKLVPGQVIK